MTGESSANRALENSVVKLVTLSARIFCKLLFMAFTGNSVIRSAMSC